MCFSIFFDEIFTEMQEKVQRRDSCHFYDFSSFSKNRSSSSKNVVFEKKHQKIPKKHEKKNLKKKKSSLISKKFFRQNVLKSPKNNLFFSENRVRFLIFFLDLNFEKVRIFSKKIFFDFWNRFWKSSDIIFMKIENRAKNPQKRENRWLSPFLWKFHQKILKNKKVTALLLKTFFFQKKKKTLEIRPKVAWLKIFPFQSVSECVRVF